MVRQYNGATTIASHFGDCMIGSRAILASVLFIGLLGSFCYPQDLPISRRVITLSPTFMEMAAEVLPTPVAGGSGTVLIVFRTSEQGAVIDMRSTGGSTEMQKSSEARSRNGSLGRC
jgi:hypothetical protein